MILPAQLVELDYLPAAFPVSGRKFPFNFDGVEVYHCLKEVLIILGIEKKVKITRLVLSHFSERFSKIARRSIDS